MQEFIIDVSDIEVLWYGTVCQIVWRKLSHCSCLKEIEMCCSTVIYWLYIVEHTEIFCITPLYLSMIHHSGKHQLNMQIWFRCGIHYYQYKIRQHKKSCNWFVYWFSNSVHRLFWHWNLRRPGDPSPALLIFRDPIIFVLFSFPFCHHHFLCWLPGRWE